MRLYLRVVTRLFLLSRELLSSKGTYSSGFRFTYYLSLIRDVVFFFSTLGWRLSTIFCGVVIVAVHRGIRSIVMFFIVGRYYGSIFYYGLRFHGIHVIGGYIFLIVNLVQLINCYFFSYHHLGLDSSIMCWHFVDVVGSFLYVCLDW